MDLRKLKSIIDLVSDSEISELEITEGEDRVRIVKSVKKHSSKNTNYSKISGAVDSPEQVEISDYSSSGPEGEDHYKVILSPMVGTFYRAPSPDANPFVEIDQLVEEGQTLCVIEAMKLMNEVPSNISGKILEILVENGEPVEFEQPLFKIES